MEVALTVIALATAVKDIVEVGQKIYESFAKVPDNFRNAQLVAEEIKEMAEEIRGFYNAHKSTLDNTMEFRVALHGLLNGKLRSFEGLVLPLLPQNGARRRDRLFRGWTAWRNNNNIERSILDLQLDIVKVMRQFVWKSTMRTEVKLETIHEETSKGLIGISQCLKDIRRDVSTLRITATATRGPLAFDPSGTTDDNFSRNIILFARSTPSASVPMLRTPDVITEELMTAAYIKFQINAIAATIAQVSALPVLTTSDVDNIIQESELVVQLEEASMDLTHLRHHIVRSVTEIRDLLANKHIHTISIYDGSVALFHLSCGLQRLGMHLEALLVGEWAVTLARMLANASDGIRSDSAALLAIILLMQSTRYSSSGDMAQALQSIKEAYSISQHLRSQSSSEVNFQLLHVRVICEYSELLEDHRHAIRMLIEEIIIFESTLGVQAFIHHDSDADISVVVQLSSFSDDLFSSVLPTTISIHAHALLTLGIRLLRGGHYEGAQDLVHLAVAQLRKIGSIHGPEHSVQLAFTLASIVQDEAANHIPAEELVNMANECIQLLQGLVEKNPLGYARNLVGVLSKKAIALESLNQDDEAITAWEEAAHVAEKIVQDSAMCARALGHLSDHFGRLQRYDDAVRTRKLAITTHQDADEALQADRYYYLSAELRQLHRFDEAVEAARASVALYRRLTMANPTVSMVDLIYALVELAMGLVFLGDYPGVMITWAESASIIENFLDTTSSTSYSDSFVAMSCMALRKYVYISSFFENKDNCHQITSTAFRYSQQLSEIYPQNADTIRNLWHAQLHCSYNLIGVGRLQDADQYLNYWFDMWSEETTVIPDSERVEWQTYVVTLKSRLLHLQGCTKEALLAIQTARSVASFQSTSAPLLVCLSMIDSMAFEAQMQLDIGNSRESLQVAEQTLQLSRNQKQELGDTSFVLSLHKLAVTALACRNYTRSIETAQECCDLCITPNWQDDEDDWNAFLRPSLFAILSSAEANLGRLGTAVEYAHRAVDASLDIGKKKWAIPPSTAEESYIDTRGNLAEILMATGDVVQAREICDERVTYFSKRVAKRVDEYRDLAPILRMLGVLCCAEGRHEKGEAAAQELSSIMQRLGCAFPSLQEQVKIRLRRQAEVPILKVLDDMTQKLDCKHQAEVSSLYAIRSTS